MMTDYDIVLKRILNSCTDFTINGKCSNCGECCGSILPVTKKEIKRIKAYVRKHNIKPHKNDVAPAVEMVIDLTCPFRNEKEHKCDIYNVRPLICKCFICNYTEIDERLFKQADKMKKIDMREVFK